MVAGVALLRGFGEVAKQVFGPVVVQAVAGRQGFFMVLVEEFDEVFARMRQDVAVEPVLAAGGGQPGHRVFVRELGAHVGVVQDADCRHRFFFSIHVVVVAVHGLDEFGVVGEVAHQALVGLRVAAQGGDGGQVFAGSGVVPHGNAEAPGVFPAFARDDFAGRHGQAP